MDEIVMPPASPGDVAWAPAVGPLRTRWAQHVSPENALPEYPRPQMARRDWLNLNGLWDLELEDGTLTRILVPYPIESALSGVMRHSPRVTYRRRFDIPAAWVGRRIRLHFGAVDWEAKVAVNGCEVVAHRGGYDPFSVDITDVLKPAGAQEVTVAVFDPTNAGGQARGKQSLTPRSIMYTATTGIWQTVWLEPVPENHIVSMQLVPDLDAGGLRLTVAASGAGTVEAVARDNGKPVAEIRGASGGEVLLTIAEPKRWSPDTPHLYDLTVSLISAAGVVDTVTSYFGMRKIALGQDEHGITRPMLNGEFVFQVGPLDQGFWPDGIYTAPTDEALRWDVAQTKRLGFNCTRKHIKVEPARWYYWCDRLGLLVWQDMPSVNSYTAEKQPIDAPQFRTELVSMVRALWNHPSIIMWVVFNESQGQHDTEVLVAAVKALDPSRLVSNASGGADKDCGDVIDIHDYPGPKSPSPEAQRMAALGEFGGLGLPVDGHCWAEGSWGYRGTRNSETLTRGYEKLLAKAWALKDTPGLSAVIYTQITDVEVEVNGLMTYDREVCKVDVARVAAVNTGRLPPPPVIERVVPTSLETGIDWHYSSSEPAADWAGPSFDDRDWPAGPGGFGSPDGPARSAWTSDSIWLRREFEWRAEEDAVPVLSVHHSATVEIYINGVLAGKAGGAVSEYEELEMTPEGVAALRSGTNLLAVRGHPATGQRFLDVGIFTERYARE